MDFNSSKPSHIFALFLVAVAFLLIIIFPLYSYFYLPVSSDTSQLGIQSDFLQFILELFILLIQIVLVAIGIFIVVPLTWYSLVNKLKIQEAFIQMRLRRVGIDYATLWGILTVFLMFGITLCIGLLVTIFGYDLSDSSNITDLEQTFSLPSLFIIVAFQPIGEEIFFRGFLLDKISKFSSKETAIILTAILFGIAHLSYGNIYPAVATGILGLLLAYMVVKTKHLFTSIVAHILYNVISVTIYILGQPYIT